MRIELEGEGGLDVKGCGVNRFVAGEPRSGLGGSGLAWGAFLRRMLAPSSTLTGLRVLQSLLDYNIIRPPIGCSMPLDPQLEISFQLNPQRRLRPYPRFFISAGSTAVPLRTCNQHIPPPPPPRPHRTHPLHGPIIRSPSFSSPYIVVIARLRLPSLSQLPAGSYARDAETARQQASIRRRLRLDEHDYIIIHIAQLGDLAVDAVSDALQDYAPKPGDPIWPDDRPILLGKYPG